MGKTFPWKKGASHVIFIGETEHKLICDTINCVTALNNVTQLIEENKIFTVNELSGSDDGSNDRPHVADY